MTQIMWGIPKTISTCLFEQTAAPFSVRATCPSGMVGSSETLSKALLNLNRHQTKFNSSLELCPRQRKWLQLDFDWKVIPHIEAGGRWAPHRVKQLEMPFLVNQNSKMRRAGQLGEEEAALPRLHLFLRSGDLPNHMCRKYLWDVKGNAN